MIFILFAKFSKVFGFTTVECVYQYNADKTPKSYYNLTLPDICNDYEYCFVVQTLQNDNTTAFSWLVFGNSPITATIEIIRNNPYICFQSTGEYYERNVQSAYGEDVDASSYGLNMFTKLNANYKETHRTYGLYNFTYSKTNIYNTNGELMYEPYHFINPYFTPSTTEIQNLEFNHLGVESGSWDYTVPLYLHVLEVTNIVDMGNNTSTYYYADDVIRLDNNSKYFEQFLDSDTYYFYIPKYVFAFNPDTQYLLVLNDTASTINNSNGIIEKNVEDNIFESVLIDTTDKITINDTINDNISNIKDDISENTVSSETETELEDSLQFDNTNEHIENINTGFFSRLTTMISNLVGYDLSEDTVIEIPIPYTESSIYLHSNILYNHVTGGLRLIINAFWFYLFSFYLYKFINKLYIAIATGNILDTFSSDNEVITNNML